MSDRRPLIAHVLFRLDYGGLENGVVNLVNGLPEERYRHAVLCLHGFNPAFRARIRRADVEVTTLDKRPGKDLPVYGRMYRAFRRLRPEIVHTRNLSTIDMQWPAFAAGVPHRIHGEHGWEASDPRGQNPRRLRIRRACRPVIQRYVPMSQDIARWLIGDVGVDPSRIRQLYSGVDAVKFKPPVTRSDEPLVIGTVGRLDPVKNQLALLEMLAALRAHELHRGRRLRLMIVGDGPLRTTLESRAVELGVHDQVQFTGARSDTPQLMRQMSVFVLPSLNEGISNTILEAMSSGLPVVAARVGGNPELVVEGVTGALYSPSAEGALDQAVLAYLRSPELRRQHGDAGRARVLQHFSLESMMQRYANLYDELLGSA